MDHKPFTFFETLFPQVNHDNLHVVTAVFVSSLLALAGLRLFPVFKKASEHVLPAKRFGVRAVFEILIEMIDGLCRDVIGHHYRQYVPLVATIFFFIFFSNLIGMIPGFLPPTENWATGAAVAIIVFLSFNYFGFREHGWAYLKHFTAPVFPSGIKNVFALILIMIPVLVFQALFGTIELIGMLLRPITLSIRLFVNISADHTVLSIFSGLAPYLVPIPFMVLGVFVCFMQAFIFSMLTMVYISMAVSHDH